jgi:hypothetical protein
MGFCPDGLRAAPAKSLQVRHTFGVEEDAFLFE